MERLSVGMYVRVPYDREHAEDPRFFLLGQIASMEVAGGLLTVILHDPFKYARYFPDIPAKLRVTADCVIQCGACRGAKAIYNNQLVRVLSYQYDKEKRVMTYFLDREEDHAVISASEAQLQLPFVASEISPLIQMLQGEWQNPRWYVGRTIVRRAISLLDGSLNGFDRLAGCKIDILPHQMLTIRRCMLHDPCRILLADEVGMGKTIEALGVLRLFVDAHPHCRILLLVPEHLCAQWRLEMLFKFDLSESSQKYHLVLMPSEKADECLQKKWDFLVADEVHHALQDSHMYKNLQALSNRVENVLFLSATPLQARAKEYLRLLCLLEPGEYAAIPENEFDNRVTRQACIERAAFNVGRSLKSVQNAVQEADDPCVDEDVADEADVLLNRLHKLQGELPEDDYIAGQISKWQELLEKLPEKGSSDNGVDPLGLRNLARMLGYISDHYQLDAHIIRNRRAMKNGKEAKRELISLPYDCDTKNPYEREIFQAVAECLEKLVSNNNTAKLVEFGIPLVSACFSSAFALDAFINKKVFPIECGSSKELRTRARQWLQYEQLVCDDIVKAMDDEENGPASRICAVLKCLDESVGRHKVVLFTEYEATWEAYRHCLEEYFGDESVALYSADSPTEERERNVFRFQSNEFCQFLLADSSGGEGHNFQMADYAVHLDLPYDAAVLEQRIGRLDRLGRQSEEPIISIVPYATRTIEEDLFHIFQEGLQVFEKPLSGMEIIMGELREMLISALESDPERGLRDILPQVKEKARDLAKALQEERNYDLNKFLFNGLDRQVRRLVNEYSRQGGKLFADAMGSWAAMAGFRTDHQQGELLRFRPENFSPKSAWQTLLLPPEWGEYYRDERAQALFKIQAAVMSKPVSVIRMRSERPALIGTFDRNLAMQMDSVHFFAPGDPVFDCITVNALNSYRGRCSAFRLKGEEDWQGLVFSYAFRPHYEVLYEQGLPDTLCRPYVPFLCCELKTVFLPLPGFPEASPNVQATFRHCLQPEVMLDDNNLLVHLGRRDKVKAIPEAAARHFSNAQWLHHHFPSATWVQQVESEAHKKANRDLRNKSRITEAVEKVKEEGLGYGNHTAEECTQALIQALKESNARLDSLAYVWMETAK